MVYLSAPGVILGCVWAIVSLYYLTKDTGFQLVEDPAVTYDSGKQVAVIIGFVAYVGAYGIGYVPFGERSNRLTSLKFGPLTVDNERAVSLRNQRSWNWYWHRNKLGVQLDHFRVLSLHAKGYYTFGNIWFVRWLCLLRVDVPTFLLPRDSWASPRRCTITACRWFQCPRICSTTQEQEESTQGSQRNHYRR